jgi:hypothetical protein
MEHLHHRLTLQQPLFLAFAFILSESTGVKADALRKQMEEPYPLSR